MTTRAAVIIAVRRDDGTVEYYASTDVSDFHVKSGGWYLGGDIPPENRFTVGGRDLQPWDPSMGMPQPPQKALPVGGDARMP